MNKKIQTALAALAFGVCATSVYAGPPERGGGPHKPGKTSCGNECKGKIDIVLEVPKHCDFSIADSSLALTAQNNYTASTTFDVSTNADYSLTITPPGTLVNGARSVPVSVQTTRGGATYASGSTVNWDGRAHTYGVRAQASNIGVGTYAGTYRGTYGVEVKF
ncbi:hypothetical protein [Acinetobacter sp.]|uniref:hypothetical protein n=1 Tax=Acinetobacter sp. TaxID=472 RepID=UPI0038905753